jgi:hypothetical protein
MHRFNIILCGFIILLFAAPCYAQLVVRGTVQDSAGAPIPNANVYATGPDPVNIKAASYTNMKGRFRLSLSLDRPYQVHVRSLGYQQVIIHIPGFPAPHTIDTTITLHRKDFKMKTLTVVGNERQTAIILKKDTIIFNIPAFARGNESSVEQLLKELPGFNVKPNGQIMVNGNTVTRVLIGNENLFGYSYPLLTRNLTAKAIKTVSVYKHYHANAALQGVSHSNQTVLNLTLKKSFKIKLFGTLTGYCDLKDHYRAAGNAISISKNFKGYLFENANNAGYSPGGYIFNLSSGNFNRLFSGEPALGSNVNSASLIGISPQHMPKLSRDRYLLNQTIFNAFGGVYKPIKKLKLKGVGYFLPSNVQVNRHSTTRYDSTLNIPSLLESRRTHKSIRAGSGKLTAEYTFSKKMNLKYVGKFNAFPEKARTHRVFRNAPLQIRLNNHDHNWDQNFKFTHRIQEKQAWQARVRYKNEATRQSYTVDPFLKGGPFDADTSSSRLVQRGKSRASYLGADVKYWHKNSPWKWSARLGAERSANRLHNGIAGQSSFFQNNYWNQYRAFAALTLRKTFFDQLKTHASITGNAIHNDSNLPADVDERLFYASPEVGFDYTFLVRQHLQGKYSLNHNQPAFENLLAGRWLSSFETIEQGADHFAVLPSNSFTFLYQYGKWQDNFVLNANVVYTKSKKRYAAAAIVTPTYSFSRYRLAKGNRTLNTGLGLNEFIKGLQSNLSFKFNFSKSWFTSYFNQTANDLRTGSRHFEATFRSAFAGDFNFTAGGDYTFLETRNLTDHSRRSHYYEAGFAAINVKIKKTINATLKDKYYRISHAGGYNFLDVRLKYKLIKDRLSLLLNATNLMDEDYFRTIYLGDYANYNQRSALNHRYVMIGVKVHFK